MELNLRFGNGRPEDLMRQCSAYRVHRVRPAISAATQERFSGDDAEHLTECMEVAFAEIAGACLERGDAGLSVEIRCNEMRIRAQSHRRHSWKIFNQVSAAARRPVVVGEPLEGEVLSLLFCLMGAKRFELQPSRSEIRIVFRLPGEKDETLIPVLSSDGEVYALVGRDAALADPNWQIIEPLETAA